MEPATIGSICGQLFRSRSAFQFAVIAYCFMPDHLHILLEGLTAESDLVRCITDFKQRSGYRFKQQRHEVLWQAGYYDHVLRRSETADSVVRYIIGNPVWAGLVRVPEEYLFSGVPSRRPD